MSKTKIKYDSSGNCILSIVKGHFMIPVTEKRYRLVDTIMINLDKKEAEKFNKMINKVADEKVKKTLMVNDAMLRYLPEELYEKIKKDFKDYFDRCDFFKIVMIGMYDDNDIVIHIDCLEELKHVS